MMNLPTLTTIAGVSFTLALSGALMPGPLLTVTVSETARRGARAGPLLITGHAILELFLVVGILNGLGPFLKAAPVIGSIALLGGLILLWMGIDMVRKAGTLSLAGGRTDTARTAGRHPVVLGVAASLANPYWIIWWVTVGLGYLISARKLGLPGIVAFFLGHIAADYGWYTLVALGISRGRAILHDSGYQMMIRVCGLFLVVFGVWFLFTAFQHFGVMA